MNINVTVSVTPGMFMNEPESVHKFMDYDALIHATHLADVESLTSTFHPKARAAARTRRRLDVKETVLAFLTSIPDDFFKFDAEFPGLVLKNVHGFFDGVLIRGN